MNPTALIHDPNTGHWLAYTDVRRIVCATVVDEVLPALQSLEQAVESDRLHAVGFLSYEAAPAFEPAAAVHAGDAFPCLWFALCAPPAVMPLPPAPATPPSCDWRPERDAGAFAADVAAIRAAIAAGETYQVNHSFFLTTPYGDDPWSLFLQLAAGAHGHYGAWIDTGRYAICSASPELFFDRDGATVACRPMKGTAPRGLDRADDLRKAAALAASAKERAENIMVLDMIRNDLARLAGGPVTVPHCCEVEQYPTVWQMTSAATTTSDASLAQVFAALFPCASITGAPKLQTMQHIARLEGRPRRLYTGAIGRIAPGRQATFSVAIRTAVIDRQAQRAEYGIGAGITWDSDPAAEYAECLAKAKALTAEAQRFELLESLLYEPAAGLFLLDAHLRRLEESAAYFSFPFVEATLRNRLQQAAAALPPQPHKLRLRLTGSGDIAIGAEALAEPDKASAPLRLRLAHAPVERSDPFLYHKTTRRAVYEQARRAAGDVDEVLLYNELGEVTEACNYNLVARIDGELVTPPVHCGLLAGTFRAELLKRGEIRERAIRVEELSRCEKLYLVNSVRRWREAVLAE